MKQPFLYSLALLLLISCNPSKKELVVLDFTEFTVTVPAGWEKTDARRADSYIGGIKIDSMNSISFDLGRYSDDLEEYLLHRTDTTHTWTIYPPLSQMNERSSKAEFCIIDGMKSKIVMPIKTGIGVTGIYIDSITNIGGNKISFEMSGYNLSETNEKLVLEAFRTLRFKIKK